MHVETVSSQALWRRMGLKKRTGEAMYCCHLREWTDDSFWLILVWQ